MSQTQITECTDEEWFGWFKPKVLAALNGEEYEQHAI